MADTSCLAAYIRPNNLSPVNLYFPGGLTVLYRVRPRDFFFRRARLFHGKTKITFRGVTLPMRLNGGRADIPPPERRMYLHREVFVTRLPDGMKNCSYDCELRVSGRVICSGEAARASDNAACRQISKKNLTRAIMLRGRSHFRSSFECFEIIRLVKLRCFVISRGILGCPISVFRVCLGLYGDCVFSVVFGIFVLRIELVDAVGIFM